MSSLIISCVIKRTLLSLADLELEEPGYCRVVAAGPGAIQQVQTWSRSPHVKGAYLTSSVPDIVSMPLVLRVEATNASNLGARCDEIYEAFQQFNYELDFEINDSALRRWTCHPANLTMGDAGRFDKGYLHNHWQLINLDIPRRPVALQGAI